MTRLTESEQQEIIRMPREHVKQVQMTSMEQPEQLEIPEYEEV